MLLLGALIGGVIGIVLARETQTEIVYVDPVRPGGYVPISRSTDPRVHNDGHHEAAAVQIGPAFAGYPRGVCRQSAATRSRPACLGIHRDAFPGFEPR